MNEKITLEEMTALGLLEAIISSSYGKGVRKGFLMGVTACVTGFTVGAILRKKSSHKKQKRKTLVKD